jgi:glutaminyl-tRNA synthetase
MSDSARRTHFLNEIIEADLAAGKNQGKVVTRFPPEPNGFLHIGHSKSIILNFGLAQQYGGKTHLRFDDTNPTTEDQTYVDAIQADVRWLGYEWGTHLYYASDFFERMYECALRLIREGKAYVDSQSPEQIREGRGSFEQPGVDSPFRPRTVEENLALFARMRQGEFKDGACVLRARIDMSHPNVLMRDPLLYRIRHAHHHRTGDLWCIYPMYDFAHPLEDAFEGVTHSICTLEFESNRELYDWVLDNLGPWEIRPRQYEFARLALGYTVMSKRKLLQLVNERHVLGWDDPRMPTLAGLRRRGVTPEALKKLAELVGVAKNNSLVDIGKFEFALRDDLEGRAPRALAVLNPLRVELTNWPKERVEALELPWWPGEPARGGVRPVPFGRELLIEREDFSEEPPKDWKRLSPGCEVRLLGAYVIRCDQVVRGADGSVEALRCSVDLDSRGGDPKDGRKVGGTLHWVDARTSVLAPVRLYDRLFGVEQPDAEGNFLEHLNPDSLSVLEQARVEPALAKAEPGARYQFLRQGFFFVDPVDSRPGAPVFNRTITLRDTWGRPAAKVEERRAAKKREPELRATPKKGRADARAQQRAQVPALAERYARYQQGLGLTQEEADLLTGEAALSELYETAVAAGAPARPAARWVLNDLLGLLPERDLAQLKLSAAELARFVQLAESGKVAQGAAKRLLAHLVAQGGDPEAALASLGLEKVEDGAALGAAVERVFSQQAQEVARYRAGEKKLLGVLIGAVMRETQGTADAAQVRKALLERLG